MSTYEISKSSLLSLKAEILRKQQELGKVKAQNDIKIRNIKKNSPLDLKNKGVNQRQERDISEEDENLLKKSKNMLEAKSKLYDKLSKGKLNLTEEEMEYNRRYLVRFDKKNSDHPPLDDDEDCDVDRYPDEDEDDLRNKEYEPAKNYDEEWVEYTDCLGRTRTCLRKDLEYLKSKDEDFKSTIKARDRRSPEPEKPRDDNRNQAKVLNISEDNELLSNDMRTEMLRRQWEKEEEALKNKSDIHYQDILFNEARTHGVGYYGFSKDEDERAKQQEALKNLREETKEQQQKSQDLKVLREKQLAARIKAAKNRKRARMGLPPEEDESEIIEPTVNETDNNVKTNENSDTDKKNVKKEKMLEEARKNHIRPWDIGKPDLRKHYEYSQEEWVDKKRRERPTEFAPPKIYDDNKNISRNANRKSLNFATRRNEENNHHKAEFKPTLIINECLSDSDDDNKMSKHDNSDQKRSKGAKIAPPATYDYYGPSSSKKPKTRHESENIGDSIEAGLRYLREQIEKKQISSKNRTDMFLD